MHGTVKGKLKGDKGSHRERLFPLTFYCSSAMKVDQDTIYINIPNCEAGCPVDIVLHESGQSYFMELLVFLLGGYTAGWTHG